MRDAVRGVVLLVAGIAMLASAAVHGVVNVPHLRADLLELGVRRTLTSAVVLVSCFSVAAMAGFGAHVLSGAVASLRGVRPQRAPLWIVAGSYVVFGFAAFALVSPTHHVLGYALMGVLVAVGAGIPGGAPARASSGL